MSCSVECGSRPVVAALAYSPAAPPSRVAGSRRAGGRSARACRGRRAKLIPVVALDKRGPSARAPTCAGIESHCCYHPLAVTQAESARHFYDRISGVYDALADASEHEARKVGLGLLAPSGSERVLEIGCGTGHALVEIAERLSEGGQVCGIDVSPGMLEVARRRVRDAGVGDRVEVRLGDALELPFAAASFDAAFSSFTLELFPRPDIPGVLGELGRVLRPGGRLGIVSMFDDGRETVMVDLYRFLHRHFPHIVDCRPIDVVTYLEDAGFAVAGRQELSIWGLPVLAAVARRPASERDD